MTYDLNINIIKYFLRVAELQNITNASDDLHITQPTLSRHIIKLEETLGVQLFVRERNGVKLTNSGEKFYNQCKKLVNVYDEFITNIFQLKDIVVGTITIGYQRTSEELLIKVNEKFLEEFPQVNIISRHQTHCFFLDELFKGNLDFVYIFGEELKYVKNVESIYLKTLDNMVLMSRNNPLTQREKVHVSDLKNEKFIMPSRNINPVKLDGIMNSCIQNGFSPNIIHYLDNFDNFVVDVVTYNAISILPYISGVEDSGLVKYVPLEGHDQSYPIRLAWLTTNTNPIVPLYIKKVQEVVSEISKNGLKLLG